MTHTFKVEIDGHDAYEDDELRDRIKRALKGGLRTGGNIAALDDEDIRVSTLTPRPSEEGENPKTGIRVFTLKVGGVDGLTDQRLQDLIIHEVHTRLRTNHLKPSVEVIGTIPDAQPVEEDVVVARLLEMTELYRVRLKNIDRVTLKSVVDDLESVAKGDYSPSLKKVASRTYNDGEWRCRMCHHIVVSHKDTGGCMGAVKGDGCGCKEAFPGFDSSYLKEQAPKELMAKPGALEKGVGYVAVSITAAEAWMRYELTGREFARNLGSSPTLTAAPSREERKEVTKMIHELVDAVESKSTNEHVIELTTKLKERIMGHEDKVKT